MKRLSFVFLAALVPLLGFSQRHTNLSANEWVDSVFKTLTTDQKIGQLMVVRLSSIGPNRTVTFYEKQVEETIRKYNIGGICLFQGGPLKQAGLINYFQSIAKTPILISIDAENGLGMRLDSVQALPRQMMMGAVQDPSLIYQYGRVVGEQCKRMGIQVNYAPVVDVNNNPNNPVINDRSFGEDKYKVASYGIQYMKGMQDVGVMACAKHFPGHGDVEVDSHYDLPVINKTRSQLDSLELYPFQQIFNAGVGSVMIAHLQIPSIDKTKNKPTSISYNNVTKLLRKDLDFKGLTFTDALEMKGVSKYYPDGEASLQAIIAGNDMLCLPGDIPGSIEKIKQAIRKKKLKQEDIDNRVKRVLLAKYQYGLANREPIKLAGLTKDLNSMVMSMKRQIAENALTLLSSDIGMLPITKGKRVAYVGVGLTKDNVFAQQVRQDYDAHVYYFGYKSPESRIAPLVELLKSDYDVVVIGLHNYARFPANNFGISKASLSLIRQLQEQTKTITLAFGNPYAIKNFCEAKTIIACYEDDDITQQTAADLLYGRFFARGRLPVTICPSFSYGTGIVASQPLLWVPLTNLGFAPEKFAPVDSIINDAIVKRAMPGAVLLVAKDGKLAYLRSYGYLTYDSIEPVYPETIYDLASVTKIMATNVAVMKLYDEGKLDLQKTVGDYLPWVKSTDKEGLKIWDVLLHQAGLKAWIPFYRETVKMCT
jgi:beta-glucosidase-like glycosyl hydrolase